eukprot:symbB.v1.2.010197.t1/scaffold621.1/size179687/3
MVGIDQDLHDEPKLLGKSRHMQIIAKHYEVPFNEMLLIDDSASNLKNTDGWQGLLVHEPKVGPRISVMSESEKRNAKQSKKAASRENRPTGESAHFAALQLLATLTEEPAEMEIKKPLAKPASENKNKNVHQSSLSGMGLKLVLPEGTERKTMKGYERVDVPAAPPFDPEKGKVNYVKIKDLPQWAQVAFKGTEKLNTIQSIVFNAAFGRSQNLLICAPTGAGKTNIAVLTILRLIGQHMDAAGGLGRDFKVVYMAPMKALVGEVSEKFQQRLGPLGVNVAEFTGDLATELVGSWWIYRVMWAPSIVILLK